MSLRKINKAFKSLGFIGNFLNTDVKVGNIYRIDDGVFHLVTSLKTHAPDLDIEKLINTGPNNKLKLTKEAGVEIKLGTEAESGIGESQVEILFEKKNSWVVALDQAKVMEIPEEDIIDACRRIWEEQDYQRQPMRYVVITALVEAASGTVIYSEDRKNRVVLSQELGNNVIKALDLASGEFSFSINTKETLEIITTEQHVPLFKAMRLKNNGSFELFG